MNYIKFPLPMDGSLWLIFGLSNIIYVIFDFLIFRCYLKYKDLDRWIGYKNSSLDQDIKFIIRLREKKSLPPSQLNIFARKR